MKQVEYASREGAAAYGYEGYFKVSSVTSITPVRNLASRQRHREEDPRRQQDFGRILADKTEQLQEERSMEGMAIGYTRNGRLNIVQPMSRTYD